MNNLTFIEDVIFVIWDWKWIKEDSDSGSDTSVASILVPAFDSEDDRGDTLSHVQVHWINKGTEVSEIFRKDCTEKKQGGGCIM